MQQKIGIVGSGLIGSSWALVFARAGCEVTVYDRDPDTFAMSGQYIRENLEALAAYEMLADPEAVFRRIAFTPRIEEALDEAGYVQESVFEQLEVKREVFERIDPLLKPGMIVGSSTSGIPASRFTQSLSNRQACLIAHPVNPPHLIPLVEIVPAPWTDTAAVAATRQLMETAGQVPILVNGELEGFILNRLQGALLNEAWWLYQEGYATADDIDKTVRDGLGLRWSFMGPFQTIDLNSPKGIAEYAERLSPLYLSVARSRSDPQPWSREAIHRAEQEVRPKRVQDDIPKSRLWRDKLLLALKKWKMDAGLQ
ncbi:MAG: 3-hydroxyacyl-CoA dehydrogenase [Desulfohalobiaceae bacterium]|nr:3-hydroxyacyl-CoA dehydrogenase [Desulfohalobiaceae bacterium]